MQKKKKIVYIISDINKAIGFEWITERLDPSKFELCFVLLNYKPSYFAEYLRKRGVPVHELFFTGKKQWPLLWWKLVRVLKKEKPDVIHTHMYIADLLGQSAGKLLGIKKRIYTRHSSNEGRKYHNKGRIDNIVNRLCTDIIAISENVRNILHEQEKVPLKKITVIHHGFDLEKFYKVSSEEIKMIREKYNPADRHPVIGVVARYSHWKGIQDTIAAFTGLREEYPQALLVLANARKGDYKDQLAALLNEFPAGSVCEIEFENNVFALYQLFDIYVHVPIDKELEAFGQTYVEALAAGIPSVFTLSGVAPEFIVHERNALVVNFRDPAAIKASVKRLLNDRALCERLVENGRNDVKDMFSLNRMIASMEGLYAG